MDHMKEAETLVLWDINSCLVPKDVDACLVGSCIESALKKAGHCKGHLSITAIGYLNHTLQLYPHLLPTIYSTGIHLYNASLGFTDGIDYILWGNPETPRPATVMIITGAAHVKHVTARLPALQSKGHTPLLAYPLKSKELITSEKSFFFWENLLKGKAGLAEMRKQGLLQEIRCETGHGMFSCKLCKLFSVEGQTFEDFTTHLKSRDHLELEWHTNKCNAFNYSQSETLVFLDIDSCKLPKDWDGRIVDLGIRLVLEKAAVSGGVPLTITAIGNLKYTSQLNPEVLPAIFSSGFRLIHVPRDPKQSSSLNDSELFLWENLVKDVDETRRQAYPPKYSVPSTWFCALCENGFLPSMMLPRIIKPYKSCGIASEGQRFKDFTKHIKSREHAINELELMMCPVRMGIEEKEDSKEEDDHDDDDFDEDRELSISMNILEKGCEDCDCEDFEDFEEWDHLSV